MSILADLIDSMTATILDGFVNTANKADHVEAQAKVKVFLTKNYSRLVHWAQENPGRRPPIHFIHDTGEVVWLSRKQTRKFQRIQAKAQRARA